MSRYELSLSVGYVRSWTYLEAVRELFQNAIDQSNEQEDNDMGFSYDNGVLRITNRNSVLEKNTLLLGMTTKADDTSKIGKFGEGYKIAALVLLREGKTFTVYNRVCNEVWTAKLVKSRKYGETILCFDVRKESLFWKNGEDSLIIEVGRLTDEEYNLIGEHNLWVNPAVYRTDTDGGSLIEDEDKVGNIYVNGLFVANVTGISYAYSFPPDKIKLDRDRQMVDAFNVDWTVSQLWLSIVSYMPEFREKALELLDRQARDVKYLGAITSAGLYEFADDVAKDFIGRNGSDAIPVTNNDELTAVKALGGSYKAVMVSTTAKSLMDMSKKYQRQTIIEESVFGLMQELRSYLDSIAELIDDNDKIEEGNAIYNRLRNKLNV